MRPAAFADVAGWDGPRLFQRTDLSFDTGDKANASLYVCQPAGSQRAGTLDGLVAQLRAHGLWSAEEPKRVRDDQRQAYQDQLVVAEVLPMEWGGAPFVLARCDHPKFPSSAERFQAWKQALAAARTAVSAGKPQQT